MHMVYCANQTVEGTVDPHHGVLCYTILRNWVCNRVHICLIFSTVIVFWTWLEGQHNTLFENCCSCLRFMAKKVIHQSYKDFWQVVWVECEKIWVFLDLHCDSFCIRYDEELHISFTRAFFSLKKYSKQVHNQCTSHIFMNGLG